MFRLVALTLLVALSLPAQKQPFDVQAMLKLQRISDPQLSPDGKMVAFTVQTVDLDRNAKPQQIYLVPLEGGAPQAITQDGSNFRPRWSPDGQRIAFISTRSGESQIWSMKSDGSEAKQITTLLTEADGEMWTPDGSHLVFLSRVYPNCTDEACNKERLEAEKAQKSKARSYTNLLYRHWTTFQDSRRQHLMSLNLGTGATKDLTPGNRDVPPFSLGGPDDYAVSPDSKEVCYSSNSDPDLSISTNSDLFVTPIDGGEPKKITTNAGADASPVYSPDGKYIAYRSQLRGGYESDRWRLVSLDRTTQRLNVLSEGLDRSVGSAIWAPDSTRVFFTVEDRGRANIQMIKATGGGIQVVVSGNSHFDDVQLTPDGKTMICTQNTGSEPSEIYRIPSGGKPVPLTRLNTAVLASLTMAPMDEFWVDAPDKTRVHSFIVKPPDFQGGKKYPVLFLIHGGPEGAWGYSWSYRWNPQVFANAGYVVVMPNPRGSTGYGQKYTEEIQADWGGKVYDDIMAVVDHVAALPYADPNRFAAAGGSYGGYMVDWMLGHTTRFKALVSHAGVYDLRSMFGETEELWFPLWEFRGTPWQDPDLYAKLSPSYFVKDFKTPTLVLHGELDYRVPVGQGMQLFTALQMQKTPSKMVLFPDEGHWILKPANTVQWYGAFLDWIGEWTKQRSAEPTQ